MNIRLFKILAGLVAILVTIVVLSNIGCSAAGVDKDAVKNAKAAIDAAENVKTICSAVELLAIDDAGVCSGIIKKISSDDIAKVRELADCIDDYSDDAAFLKCVDDIDGISSILEKIKLGER